MKKFGFWFLVLFFAVGYLSSLSKSVFAVPSEDRIKAACQSAQSVLSQVEKSDAVLRINRGRAYNEVGNLFYAMNSRLSANKIPAPILNAITADFEKRLDQFRDDYNSYDDDLKSLIQMDCRKMPTDFYRKLVEFRTIRAKLSGKVQELDSFIQEYAKKFKDRISQYEFSDRGVTPKKSNDLKLDKVRDEKNI